MPHIFISYSRVDKPFIEKISVHLRGIYGYENVWYDDELIGGQLWWEEIKSQIKKYDVFLYLMSRDSIESYYCLQEAKEASELAKPIIPVLVRARTEIPEDLKKIHHIDMSSGVDDFDACKRLESAINHWSKSGAQKTDNDYLKSSPLNEDKAESLISNYENLIDMKIKYLLVEAGPGTGKTFSLLQRVVKIINEGGDPRKVLLVTFTRRAAIEIREKLEKLGLSKATQVQCLTLHSFCFSLLHNAHYFLQTGRTTRILLDFEKRLMLEDLKIEASFGNLAERKRRLKAFEAAWAREQHHSPDSYSDVLDKEFEFRLIEWLRFHRAMLIEEVVKETLGYIRSNPDSPDQQRYDHVLVDEYQDLNKADQSLIDLISMYGNLMVVGDRNQSIYGDLRYAHPEGIAEFYETHPGASRLELIECQRCPSLVVKAANKLITSSGLISKIGSELGEVHVVQWKSVEEEAEGVARFINEQIRRGDVLPGRVLILSPRRQLGYLVRKILHDKYEQPVHSFFREEIVDSDSAKEALTLLQLIVNPNDLVAFRCWLGFHHADYRFKEYARLLKESELLGISPNDLLVRILGGTHSVKNISGLFDRYRKLDELLRNLENKSDLEKFDAIFPQGEEWAEPFRTIVSLANDEQPELAKILKVLRDHISQPELPVDVEYIRIMSLHSSKGLDADLVVIMGCIDGLIPKTVNEKLTYSDQKREQEEQKRLFYVALTRTKKTLVLSSISYLSSKLAHRLKLKVPEGVSVLRTSTSTFISKDLRNVINNPVSGDKWTY
jgi:DNA helicase II / ATP-dependent DNA helicase PcrA